MCLFSLFDPGLPTSPPPPLPTPKPRTGALARPPVPPPHPLSSPVKLGPEPGDLRKISLPTAAPSATTAPAAETPASALSPPPSPSSPRAAELPRFEALSENERSVGLGEELSTQTAPQSLSDVEEILAPMPALHHQEEEEEAERFAFKSQRAESEKVADAGPDLPDFLAFSPEQLRHQLDQLDQQSETVPENTALLAPRLKDKEWVTAQTEEQHQEETRQQFLEQQRARQREGDSGGLSMAQLAALQQSMTLEQLEQLQNKLKKQLSQRGVSSASLDPFPAVVESHDDILDSAAVLLDMKTLLHTKVDFPPIPSAAVPEFDEPFLELSISTLSSPDSAYPSAVLSSSSSPPPPLPRFASGSASASLSSSALQEEDDLFDFPDPDTL